VVPFHPPLIVGAWCVALSMLAAPAHGEGRAGDFDFYILSLSWLPGYCSTNPDPDERQCAHEAQGFVVHGLWPQYESGYPEFCPSSMPRWLSEETVALIRNYMPSAGAARYQWQKHGMCSGLDEVDYFSLLVDAADRIAIPDEIAAGGIDLPPRAIEAAFADVNPGITAGGMSVQCRDGAFTEIRICMTKDLAFRDCPEVNADTCRASEISIPSSE
jgi:ribonuclease T2